MICLVGKYCVCHFGCTKYCIQDCNWLWGLLHFFTGFLPTVIGIAVIWINLPHSHPFGSWIQGMSSVILLPSAVTRVQFTLIHGANIEFLCNTVLCNVKFYFNHQISTAQASFPLWPLNHSLWAVLMQFLSLFTQ